VILVDANLLLYAYHPRAEQHERARAWLEAALSGLEPVGLPWSTVLAFLRLATSPRVFARPLSTAEAEIIVSTWLAEPSVVLVSPGDRYWEILRALLIDAQVTGPLVTDAALAALAIEHGATLVTTDRDFARFRGLRLSDPLQA
jgi:toxin-antitoxin system PIN domain toxin